MIGLPMAYHALGRKADSDAALAALIAKYEKERPLQHRLRLRLPRRGRPSVRVARQGGRVRRRRPRPNRDGEPCSTRSTADPRWLPFLRKIGKAPEQLAKIEFKVTLPQAEGATASGSSNK
jgi:hypothetical protein